MLTNGEIYNACVFETDICDVNGGTIILASYSGFECDKFTAGGFAHVYGCVFHFLIVLMMIKMLECILRRKQITYQVRLIAPGICVV